MDIKTGYSHVTNATEGIIHSLAKTIISFCSELIKNVVVKGMEWLREDRRRVLHVQNMEFLTL